MLTMVEDKPVYVALTELRIGMFIHLELGWMSHPFPSSSFKIANDKQIETICSLGLKRVRYSPSKSDVQALPESAAAPAIAASVPTDAVTGSSNAPSQARSQTQALLHAAATLRLQEQRRSFAVCEEKYRYATQACSDIMAQVGSYPVLARERAQVLVDGLVDDLVAQSEAMIHLLSDGSGERAALHPVNVTVLCLLLGKTLALDPGQLRELGLAALLHDVGKLSLPQRLHWQDPSLSPGEDKMYKNHVSLGVAVGRRMGLSSGALLGISQHHEMVDGSGFPAGVLADGMSVVSRVLALVNSYDNLCNPLLASHAATPHEALALLFAQSKTRFDAVCLNAFVRLMGVYPPGSVVQLSDERYALVMTVNSARPLRPQVILYDAKVPKDQALVVDLEQFPNLGIRRSLKPVHLPQSALSYLSPRKRISYFFDQTAAWESARDAP